MREGWEVKTVGELASVSYGFTDKALVDGEYRYVRITDINNDGELTSEEKRYVQYSDEAKNFLLEDQDLLMARTGATFAKVLLYRNDEPSIYASYLIKIDFKVQIENKLYWYFSKSENYWEQANKLSSGSAQPHFNGAALKKVAFTYPKSLPEQKQIVAILDQAFAAIDQAKANIEKNIQNAKELFQSKLNEIFSQTGEGWEEKTLEEIFTFRQGIQKGVKLQSEIQLDGQVRFLRIVDYTQGNELPRYIDNPGEQYIINENDISLVRYGASTGFVCKGFSGALANNLFRVIPKDGFTISSNYLYYFLASPVFQAFIKSKMNGAAMPAISFGMISNIPFPITTLVNQEKIANDISLIEVKTTELINLLTEKISSLEELKKSILQKAFAGELTSASSVPRQKEVLV